MFRTSSLFIAFILLSSFLAAQDCADLEKKVASLDAQLDMLYGSIQVDDQLKILDEIEQLYEQCSDREGYWLTKSRQAELNIFYKDWMEVAPDTLQYYIDRSAKEVGEDNRCKIYCTMLQAELSAYGGDFEESERLFLQALEYTSSVTGSRSTLEGLASLTISNYYASMAKFEKSQQYAIAAYQYRLQQYGDQHIKTAIAKGNLGNMYYLLGFHNKAIYYLEQVLDFVKKTGLENHMINAGSYNTCGAAHLKSQSYELAGYYFDESLELSLEVYGDKSFDVAQLYINKGYALMPLGRYELAIENFNKAIGIFQSLEGDYQAQVSLAKSDLGIAYLEMGQYDSAGYYLQSAVKSISELFGNEHDEVIRLYYFLANLYQATGADDRALGYITDAVRWQQKLYHPDHPAMASGYNKLGSYYHSHLSDSAIFYVEKAIQVNADWSAADQARKGAQDNLIIYDHGQWMESLKISSEIYYSRYLRNGNLKDLLKAFEHVKNGCAFILKKRKAFISDADVMFYNEQQSAFFRLAFQVVTLLFDKTGDAKYLDEVHRMMEMEKASLLLLKRRLTLRRNATLVPEKTQLLERKILEYERQIVQEQSDEAIRVMHSQLSELKFELDRQTKGLRKISSLRQDLATENQLVGLEELTSALKDDEVLLSYSLKEDSSMVMVMTNEQTIRYALAPASRIQSNIDELYNTIQNESEVTDFKEASQEAFALLLEPFYKEIADKRRLIIVNPVLLSIPFESVLTYTSAADEGKQEFQNLSYLAKKHAISYHYSASIWYHNRQSSHQSDATPSLLAIAPFASPTVKNSTDTRTENTPLPQSGIEVEALSKLFQKNALPSEVGFADEANREFFFEHAQQASIIHIATHTEADYQHGNLARIHLAKLTDQSADQEQSYLYPSSLYTVDLPADLVVLSSCDSGSGKVWDSEGVISLGRAFLFAGAHNVVVSLWEVDDRFSREFMIAFYQHFLSGLSYSQALHKAKSAMINSEDWSHPKYWSSFTLIGGS